MSWQSNFSNSTTNLAFCLRLTKAQVASMRLAYLYSQGMETYSQIDNVRSITGIDRGVPAMKELINRGLIEHHPNPEGGQFGHIWYTLTPAGILAYDMLVLANLIPARNETLRGVA